MSTFKAREMLAQYGKVEAWPDPLDGLLAKRPALGDSPVHQAAEAWQALGCPRGLLLHGEALQEAERWAAGYAELGEAEQDFLQECRDAERHAQREGWWHSLLRGVVTLAVLGILVAAHGWWMAHEETLDLSAAKAEAECQLEQRAEAMATLELLSEALAQARDEAVGQSQMANREMRAAGRQVQAATSLALAAQSHLVLEQDPDLALLLAVQACRLYQPLSLEGYRSDAPEIKAALHHALGHPDWWKLLEQEALPRPFTPAWMSPDGRLLCAPHGEGPSIWDAASGERLLALQRGNGETPGDMSRRIHSADWNHDGSRVAAIELGDLGQQVTIWDTATGGALWRSDYAQPLVALVWSPDGSQLLLLGEEGGIEVLDAAAGYRVVSACQMTTGQAVAGPVNGAAWANDGRSIRVYAESGVYDCDVTQGDQGDFSLLSGTGDAYSNHAKKAVPVWMSDSQRVMLYDLEDLADLACARVARDMTAAEWARYMGADTPYRATCPGLGNP